MNLKEKSNVMEFRVPVDRLDTHCQPAIQFRMNFSEGQGYGVIG